MTTPKTGQAAAGDGAQLREGEVVFRAQMPRTPPRTAKPTPAAKIAKKPAHNSR